MTTRVVCRCGHEDLYHSRHYRPDWPAWGDFKPIVMNDNRFGSCHSRGCACSGWQPWPLEQVAAMLR